MVPKFNYDTITIQEIKPVVEPSPIRPGKTVVTSIKIRDKDYKPTDRFWTSLNSRFGVSPSIYRWFDYHEVFSRVADKVANDRVRITVEHGEREGQRPSLLGATNPARPLITYKRLSELLDAHGTEEISYRNGVVTSTHKLRRGDEYQIFGDTFENRFTMQTPVDGYGLPNIYLSLLRQVCSNGMIAYSKAFKTPLALGRGEDDVSFAIVRALESFNNEEGFHALRQRIESSGSSWASLNETFKLSDVLHKAIMQRCIKDHKQVMDSWWKKTGDLSAIYSLASINELTKKKMRTLPSKATVYDLINFATEVATHHCESEGQGKYWQRRLHGYVGDVISQEYDLEGTCETFRDFDDWFVESDIRKLIERN